MVRINKYLSEHGICSRREADRLISDGRVLINGETALLGSQVKEGDLVVFDDEVVGGKKPKKIYIAFNKPKGIETTTDNRVNKNIIDFINYPERIFPIGRLDKESEGLILLTNDGDIVNKILRVENGHEKEYEVVVDKPINDDFLHKMGTGVQILDTITLPCTIEKLESQKFRIILKQGLNRQIRRMCEALGYKVKKLKRVRIMNIYLDQRSGKYRLLNSEEVSHLIGQIQE